MSFGNILGQLLEQGISGQDQTRARLDASTQSIAQGGLADIAKAFLSQPQAGGMTGAQIGGLGAIAGALIGGGGRAVRGAAGGGAMAILGTLALAALQNARAGGQAGPGAQVAAGAAPTREDVAAVVSEEGERLALRAMIAAAKADGQIDLQEMDRILGRMNADEVTDAERRFVVEEISRPLDPADLAKDVRNPAQAAEVYAASLLAIDVDSEPEREYLRALAAALRLDPGTVSFLHRTTGAPAA
mgnify:CR=1 FL=1